MKNIYLTGANGFIGKKLKDRLFDVTSIKHQDLYLNKLEPFNRFFFCSTYGNMAFHEDDAMTIKANVFDLAHVLFQIDKEIGFESFVYISTSSVKRPTQTMYSRSKKMAEELLLGHMDKYQLPVCIIRPLSVTGVGEQKEHLIPKLIDSCLNGTRMDFVEDPRHDFIDVDDFVDGVIALSDRHARGVFELGNGHSYSNRDVLDIVERVTGKKANLSIVKSMRKYDTKSDDWVATDTKARDFGWKPKKTLELTITEMVNDIKRSQTN